MPAFFRVTPDPRPADPAAGRSRTRAPPSSGKSEAKPRRQQTAKGAQTCRNNLSPTNSAAARGSSGSRQPTGRHTCSHPLAQPQQVIIKALVAQLGDERLNLDNQTITSSTGERIDVAETLVWQGGTQWSLARLMTAATRAGWRRNRIRPSHSGR